MNTQDELVTLHDELQDAHLRHSKADIEGKKAVKFQIKQIERDIRRNSMKQAGSDKNGNFDICN